MGLETVKEEVIRSAKSQEQSLIAEARKETVRLMNEAEKKIAEMKQKSNVETKRIADVIKKQELASAELDNKKMLLETKKQLIGSVFAELKKNLERLDGNKRESYINNLLEKAKNDIEVESVYCNKKDLKFVKDFKTEATDILGGFNSRKQG